MLNLLDAPRCYRFADLRLDTGQRQLWRATEPLPLPRLSFDTLLALVVNAPNVVSHDELATLVWGESKVVTLENISQRVMSLRRCLGDSTREPRYIRGVRGLGYRLVPHVVVASTGGSHLGQSGAGRTDRIGRGSVAVLPFVRATTDPREPDFIQGLHEEVTQCVGRLIDVKAIPPGRPRPGSGERGDRFVESIAKGNVRVSGNRVRAVVHVVDPDTCSVVWSQAYDRDIANALELQTDIARDLVQALSARFRAASTDEDDRPRGTAGAKLTVR